MNFNQISKPLQEALKKVHGIDESNMAQHNLTAIGCEAAATLAHILQFANETREVRTEEVAAWFAEYEPCDMGEWSTNLYGKHSMYIRDTIDSYLKEREIDVKLPQEWHEIFIRFKGYYGIGQVLIARNNHDGTSQVFKLKNWTQHQ